MAPRAPHSASSGHFPLINVSAVMFQIDGAGCAVVFAHGMQRGGIAEATQVFSERRLGYFQGNESSKGHVAQKKIAVISQQRLRHRRGLREKKPMEVRARKLVFHGVVYRERRNYIQYGQLGDGCGMIEGHAMCDASTAIMPDDGKFIEAQCTHDFDLVARHRTLGIGFVRRRRCGFAAVAVAAQIRCNHRIFAGEHGRHILPLYV